MNAVNLLNRIRGAASLHMIGQDFWTQDVAALDLDPKPIAITSQAHGQIASRVGGRLITLAFTPVGVWTDAQLAVAFPQTLLNPRMGDFSTPVRPVTSFDHTSGEFIIPDHGFLTGTGVRGGIVDAGSVLPVGFAAATTYYVSVVDEDTIKISDTEAHAIAGSNFIAMTSDGTGTMAFVQNTPLIITTVDGFQLTIWNAAIVTPPPLSLGALASVMKQIKIEGYTLHGQKWSDAGSLYTVASGQIGAVPPDQSKIPTVPYVIDWATRLPIVSVDDVGNELEIPAHGLSLAETVTIETESADGVIPTGLAISTTYYVIVVDADHIKLATSAMNAGAGTAIAITSTGAGVLNIVSAINVEGLEPREAIDVTVMPTWGEVPSGSNGLNCRSLSKVMTKVEFVPTNLSLKAILNLTALQGGAAVIGQNLPSADMDIYGPNENPFLRVYGASLQNTPGRFGTEADRVDKLTFVNIRSFRGVKQNPVIFIGTSAPDA